MDKKIRKKILYFVQLPPPVHGVSTINKYIVESKIINEDFETQILEIKFSDKISELKKITFKKCIKVPLLIFKLITALRIFKPDLIYFSIMPAGKGFIRDLLFVVAINFFKVTPVFHIHNQGIKNAGKNSLLKYIYKLVFSNSVIIHLSENLMAKEIDFLKLKNVRKFVVNNGVEEVKTDKTYTNNDKVKLLYLSNLFPGKGLNILVESLKILKEQGFNFTLNIIGSVRDEKIYKNILSNNKYLDINFLGEQFNNEKIENLEKADIFVHPTTNDSFPLVILEAMRSGLPVISTIEGAIPEIIDDGETGILIEKGNVDQLVESIKLLITNYELRITMGQKGREKYLAKYTKTMFEENIRKVLNTIKN